MNKAWEPTMRPPKPYGFIMLFLLACLGCGYDARLFAFENIHPVPMTAEKIIDNYR
jgi:hypothetical protein